MKDFFLFIFSLFLLLAMASCQTAPEAPAVKDKSEKTTVPTSVDLNGKWIVAVETSSPLGLDKYTTECKITQTGNRITIENIKYEWVCQGNIEGNSILLEPITYYSHGGHTAVLNSRELKISSDENTLKGSYNFTLEGQLVMGARMKETYSRQ